MSAIPQLMSKFSAILIKIPKMILLWKNKDNFQRKKKVRSLSWEIQCLQKTIIIKVV